MIDVEGKILGRDLFEKQFVCDLSACKGQCCIDGDSGAPLTKEELPIIEDIYLKVKPYLREEGIEAIERQGKYVVDWDTEHVTPLVNERECAYAIFDENNTAKCGIEAAYENGDISFKKPISCHLYPIRITKYQKFDALNYSQWNICKAALICGQKLKVKVYQFLKEPLIRKYGEDWYAQVEEVDKLLSDRNK